MRRSDVRTTLRNLLAPAVITSAMALMAASPAHAAVLWTADPASGTGSFSYTACDGGSITTHDGNDGHGPVFRLDKPAGSDRCEVAGAAGRTWSNDTTYWWGWRLRTSTPDAQTVFQWKSWGTGEEQQQNYPVLMKVEDGRLKIWYVAPGEIWKPVGSREWTTTGYHKIELGITTRSDNTGSFALYVDGSLVVDQRSVRTWDDRGNNPRWGTYGSAIGDVDSTVWIDDLRLGQTRADVD
ncbi:heparin lyase I family protein [Streptomyces sp. NPDC049916]|uniref:heparin lyase I family protein n=1 Tax=Streptomyces sp. NPDC049916 TaxID=3155156 RepID=UPI00343F8D6F